METCECRTVAITRCRECETPICMHHSRLLDGRTLCLSHHEEALRQRAPRAEPPSSPVEEAPRRRGWGRRK